MKRILILGGGFGGVYTALELVKAARRDPELDVLIVSQDNYFFFTPFLTEVVGGVIGLRHVAEPIRRIFAGSRIRFKQARVTAIDVERRKVASDAGELEYDLLVMALGSVSSFFGLESVERNALTLKSLLDAIKVRERVIACLERAAALPGGDPRRSALLTFVVAGGGPSGVELASDLGDLIRQGLLPEYPELAAGELRVVLAEARERILPGFDPRLVELAMGRMRARGIDIRLSHAIDGYEGGQVRFKGIGEHIRAETLVWTAGIAANPVLAGLPGERDRMGRVKVDELLRLPGHAEVFVLGDGALGADEGGAPFGPEAQVALQQARATGKNLLRSLRGEPLVPFRFKRLGRLVSVGTHWAITEVMGVKLRGFLGWFAWRTIYLVKIKGWKNRLRVVIDWTLDLFFGRETSRIIHEG